MYKFLKRLLYGKHRGITGAGIAMGIFVVLGVSIIFTLVVPIIQNSATQMDLAEAMGVLDANGYTAYADSSGTLTMTGQINSMSIIPKADSTYGLGTTTARYLNGWFDNITASNLTATVGNFTTLNAPTGRSATYVIAASDSSASDKASADEVCPAANPEVNLQAAFTAQAGKKIVLLPGTYTKGNTAGLTIPSNTTVEIQGTIIFANNVGNNPFIFACDTVSNIKIIGSGAGTLDGNRTNQTTTTGNSMLISWTTVTNGEITGLNLQNAGTNDATSGYGVYLNGSSYNRIHNNYANANKKQNICVYNNSNYNTINGNISVAGGETNFVSHSADYNVFSDNVSVDGLGEGIDIYDSLGCVVSNNTVVSSAASDIIITDSSVGTVINGNDILANDVADTGAAIFLASTSTDSVVTGNRIISSARDGIYSAGDRNIISSNKIDSTTRFGLYVQSTSDNCIITSNDIYNSSSYGVLLYGTGHIFSNNTVNNNTTYGVYVSSATNTGVSRIVIGSNVADRRGRDR